MGTTAATLWSTALARDIGGKIIFAERPETCWQALARARATRLPSVYIPRDRSLSQVFVDEGVDGVILSPRSIRTLVAAEHVPARSSARLAALVRES